MAGPEARGRLEPLRPLLSRGDPLDQLIQAREKNPVVPGLVGGKGFLDLAGALEKLRDRAGVELPGPGAVAKLLQIPGVELLLVLLLDRDGEHGDPQLTASLIRRSLAEMTACQS
jgi:hypothetical protein